MLASMLLTFQYLVEAHLSIYCLAISSRCTCMMFQNKVQDEFYTVRSHAALYTPHTALNTLYTSLHTPHSTFTLYTSHSTPYTLHFTLHIYIHSGSPFLRFHHVICIRVRWFLLFLFLFFSRASIYIYNIFLPWCLMDLSLFFSSFIFSADISFRFLSCGFDFDVDTESEEL